MWNKSLLLMTSAIFIVGECGLLRTPKVYNALITTDENLTSSRAFPVVQPVLQAGSPAFGPLTPYNNFAYDIYDPYNPFAFQQARNFAYRPQDQPQRYQQTEPRTRIQLDSVGEDQTSAIAAEASGDKKSERNTENQITGQAEAQQASKTRPQSQNSPIPLNEFGLPPSLVPIQRFGPPQGQQPQINYNPYPYNFPVIFDSFGSYNSAPYPVLPPFPYYQQTGPALNQQPSDGLFNPVGIPEIVSNRNGREGEQERVKAAPAENIPSQPPLPQEQPQPSQQPLQPENINIKNYSKENPDIPDVPAPPLPTSKGTSDAAAQSSKKE